jgi:hypothetical protein
MTGRTQVVIGVVLGTAAAAGVASGADCTGTSTGLIPLTELRTGLYLGQFQGGLYPNGVNFPPLDHVNRGRLAAAAIVPRLPSGAVDPESGRIVLLSIGMSNTTQEYCGGNYPSCQSFSFIGQAASHPGVDDRALAIVDGAAGGQDIPDWDSPTDANYNRVRDTRLTPNGFSEAQVQAIWIKQAIARPTASLPASNADAYAIEAGLGNIVRAARVRYPNLRMVFLSSRIYAGYADTDLNPEPYAYEGGFGVKWVIEAQINQLAGGGVDTVSGDLGPGVAPWIGWGPYLWADGLTPRQPDGLTYQCSDFNPSDGTHPATGARTKVGSMLLDFFLTSPFSPWFRAPCNPDYNDDGSADQDDVAYLINVVAGGPNPSNRNPDFDRNGSVDQDDVTALIHVVAGGSCPNEP